MKPLLLFLLLSTAAWGQDKLTISKSETVQQDTIPVTIKAELPDNYYFLDGDTVAVYKAEWILSVIYDTIPVSLLVRISGRPWAFFHDGWEVRKVTDDPGKYLPMQEPCDIPGCAVYHPFVLRSGKNYSHLLYLDSRKRPIRKEWVVYQTFKR